MKTATERRVMGIVALWRVGREAASLYIYRLSIYDKYMIRSFRCEDTKAIFQEERMRKFQRIAKVALRKLVQLNRAKTLEDLKSPGNALEALKDDRKGQHAIRINEQYRLCFTWAAGDAENVEIVDYH